MEWRWILSLDVILFLIVFCLVIYFLFQEKRKRRKKLNVKDFTGILEEGKNAGYWYYEPTTQKKKNKKKNKHEEKCRKIFEDIFGKKFKTCRPDWLKNPATGKNLELDGYCDEILTPLGRGLAFEYDGIQHARYSAHFHRNGPNEFIYQTKKDKWKDMRCKQQGVLLIRIPHIVAYGDLERYISTRLSKYGLATSPEPSPMKQEDSDILMNGLYR